MTTDAPPEDPAAEEAPPAAVASFFTPGFEPPHYLRTVLKLPPPYDSQKEDLAEGLRYVKRQLQREVALHHEELLGQVAVLRELDRGLEAPRAAVAALQTSLKRLRHTVKEPHDAARGRVVQLRNMWAATELLRRLQRFAALMAKLKELEAQAKLNATGGNASITMDLPKVAKLLRDVEALLEESDMKGVTVVDQEREWLATLGKSVRAKAQELLKTGVETQGQAELGTAIQALFNLEILPQSVKDALERQKREVKAFVYRELDATAITKAVATAAAPSPEKGSAAPDPKAAEAARLRLVVFGRLDAVAAFVHQQVAQAAGLHRTLAKRRDPVSHVPFLDAVTAALGPGLLEDFWTSVSQGVRERLTEAMRRGAIHQMLITEYPRLHRLMSHFANGLVEFCPWMVPTAGPAPSVAPGGPMDPRVWSQETIASYEKLFTAASQHRLYEKVEQLAVRIQQACPSDDVASQVATGAERDRQTVYTPSRASCPSSKRPQPSVTGLRPADSRALSAAIAQELTSIHGERALRPLVLTNVAKALQLLGVRCEGAGCHSPAAAQTTGNPTNAQLFNASLYNALTKLTADVVAAVGSPAPPAGHTSRPDDQAAAAIATATETLRERIAELEAEAAALLRPVMAAATKTAERLLLKIHNEDFVTPDLGRAGAYVGELEAFLQALKHRVLHLFDAASAPYVAASQQLGARLLTLFVRHAALHRPMSDAGRMRLSTDVAQLQLAIGTLCGAETVGTAFRECRAFRSLLFMDLPLVPQSAEVRHAIVHPLNVLHHLCGRATRPDRLPLPHELAGKSLEQLSNELDTLADPNLEGTDHQYDPYLDHWQAIAKAATAYGASSEIPLPHRTELAAAIHAVGALFWSSVDPQ